MKKAILGVLAASVVYFVWGWLSWTVLPWHDGVIKTLPEEQLILDTLKIVVPKEGFYVFPGEQPGAEMGSEAHREKYRSGPIGVLAFSPKGAEPMSATQMIVGFAVAIAASLFAAVFLAATHRSVSSFLARVLLVTSLGLLVWLVGVVPGWNWFHFPGDYTRVLLIDHLSSFFLIGVVLAFFSPKSV